MDTEKQIAAALTDPDRISALHATGLRVSGPNVDFDRLTKVAAKVSGAPVAIVSLVEPDHVYLLSQSGLPEPLASGRRLEERTFCHYALLSNEPLVINDVGVSSLYRDVPVVNSLGVQAYLGVPLCTDSGEQLGNFCLMDFKPRVWTEGDVELVSELARSTMQEITLQKKMDAQEAQLKRKSEQLRTIIDALPSMVGYWDQQLKNQFANKAYSNFFNTDPQALAGRHIRELMGEQLFSLNLPHMLQALAGHSVSFQRDIPAKDGQGFRHSLAHYIPDISEGQVQGFLALVHDISPVVHVQEARDRVSRTLRLLKDANMAVAKAENQQQLLESICRLVCADASYVMAWVGYAQNDPEKTLLKVAYAGDGGEYLQRLKLSWDEASPLGIGPAGVAVRTGKTQIVNDISQNSQMQPWRAKARESGYASGIAIPFQCRSGVRGCLVLYATRPNAFGADEVSLLEELCASLTFGLDSLAERHRRIHAESASKAKADFLANMSHEIRTPLNAISGLAYLIRKDGLTPQQMERMVKLETSSQHLLSIISDILELSKIESGKLNLAERPFHLDTVVSNVISMVYDKASAKSLNVRKQVDSAIVEFVGDATRIQQALLNYVGNAVKFTEAGSVDIRVRIQEESVHDALVYFEVRDTGIGISQDTQRRLFEAFEQADNTNTREYGGTGLGLAITRQLVEYMGGRAGVESRLGQGSTFWFTVRLKRQPATVQPPIAQDLDVKAQVQSRFAGHKFLLVEDEPVNQEIGTIYLEDVGIEVDLAENGLKAVALASANPYSLIFMDVRMPTMDGLEATRQIRKMPHCQTTPIIACTANAYEEDKQQCIAAGMNDFITKPLPPAEVYAAILRNLA